MHDDDLGAAVRVGERGSHRHLAAQPGIVGLELEHLDHLLVGHEPGEVAVVRVGVRADLPVLVGAS